ncbi:MAG: hypothetical protein ACKVVP_22530 [Chloroflexota bacterium]
MVSSMPVRAAERDSRFGINQAWQAADQADTAGAGWSRVVFWWSELQKSGTSEFDLFATDHDAYFNSEVGRGRELAGVILNTPRWASTDGSSNGVPKNLYLPFDHPDNHWGQFTGQLAEHYKGRIDTWIIWNEVDIQRGQWSTWNGTTADYVQLLKVAYRSMKAANPRAKVLPFGAAWWYDSGATVSRMLDLIVADPEARRYNGYMDAANLHLYSRSNDIPRMVGWYRDQLQARGLEKPIWVGETNAVPYDDPHWRTSKENFRASLDEQASYIVQAFATYVALGVQKASVNRMTDGTDFDAGGEPFGMLRNDGSPRPALTAFQVVTRYFSGAESGEFFPTEVSGLTRAVLKKSNEVVTVAWNMRPETVDVTVPATSLRALRVNKYGQASLVQAVNGQYRFTLTPATANSNESDRRDFVVGGSPLILIERQDGDPQAAYRAIR